MTVSHLYSTDFSVQKLSLADKAVGQKCPIIAEKNPPGRINKATGGKLGIVFLNVKLCFENFGIADGIFI